MILLIDNYDSFTYNLVDYFGQLGCEVNVLRNDSDLEEIKNMECTGVVLSPGPERPETAGNLFEIISHFIGQKPILGICLGHQAIAQHLGGELVKAIKPMHGKISKLNVMGGKAFRGTPTIFDVVRYHSLVVQGLPECLKATAKTDEGELMAFESEQLMAWGLQFHPEAILTQYGLHILRNWVTFYNIVCKGSR